MTTKTRQAEDLMSTKIASAIGQVRVENAYAAQLDNCPWECVDMATRAIQFAETAGVKSCYLEGARRGPCNLFLTFNPQQLIADTKLDDPDDVRLTAKLLARTLRTLYGQYTHVQVRINLLLVHAWRTEAHERNVAWTKAARKWQERHGYSTHEHILFNPDQLAAFEAEYGQQYPYVPNFDQTLVEHQTIFAVALLRL